MRVHSVKSIQKIPATLEQVWDFYSHHANLLLITPAYMKFEIISQNNDEKLHTGQVIEYTVRPVFTIALHWVTAIRMAEGPGYFMDEQRKGPFSAWQHQHYFKAIEGGTEMTDIVLYKNPFGIIGELANVLLVKRKLRNLFEYRFDKIEDVFGKWQKGQERSIDVR